MIATFRLALGLALTLTLTTAAPASAMAPFASFGPMPVGMLVPYAPLAPDPGLLHRTQVDARKLAECRGTGTLRAERDCFLILRSIELD